jgi:ABC-type multidrug transport system fused ATPase/permease subunit
MFFTLGQSAGAIGGIMMLFAALVCFLLVNMLGFGVLANTIENFSQGKLEANFMPDFDDFNLWDDVVHPFFLAIGTYIVSFGALILVLVIGIYFLISSMQDQMRKMQTEKVQTETPFLIDEKKAMNQSDEVKKLVAGINEKAEAKRDLTENGLDDEDFVSSAQREEEEFEEINEMIQQHRKQELEAVVGKTEETKREEFKQMVSGFLSQGIVLLLLTIAAFFWGLFYFPAACAVAGYTRSFFATINPTVGIDTIKTLGADYFKILGIYILLLIAAVFVGMIFNIIFLPFALPGMGNLPAIAASSWFTFYFTIVFSCVLGFALFKNSHKFKFYRG